MTHTNPGSFPFFDDLFHDDCVIVTAEGETNKSQWAEMAKGLRAKGTLKDGQLLRIDPVDPSAYSEMVERSSQARSDAVAWTSPTPEENANEGRGAGG